MNGPEIGVVMFALGVVLGAPIAYRWAVNDEKALRDHYRAKAERADERCRQLLAEVASLRPAPLHYKLTCGICGPLVVSTDLIPEPLTDEQFATALEVLLTEHAINAHLDEVTL